MNREIIKKFADAHKNSSLYGKKLNYDLMVDFLFKIRNHPSTKDADIYKIFDGFFDGNKFTSNDAMALQFQAAVDWVMYSARY